MKIVKNQAIEMSLIEELDSVVENLKEVFSELDRKDSTKGEKYNLEKEKDEYFNQLNQLLPRLAEGRNTLYGEYFARRLKYSYINDNLNPPARLGRIE